MIYTLKKYVVLAPLISSLFICGASNADTMQKIWSFVSFEGYCSIMTYVTPQHSGIDSDEASVSLVIYYDDQFENPKNCNSGTTKKSTTAMIVPGLGGDILADTHAILQSPSLREELAPVHYQGRDCSIGAVYTWDHRATGVFLEALENAENIMLTAHLSEYGMLEGRVYGHGFPGAYTQLKSCISGLL